MYRWGATYSSYAARVSPRVLEAPARLDAVAAELEEYFAGRRHDFDLPLDLSLSALRSVSPIHIEYLRNMGVGASMSVSILRQGKLRQGQQRKAQQCRGRERRETRDGRGVGHDAHL